MTTEQIKQLRYFLEQIEGMADNVATALKQGDKEDAEYWTIQQELAAQALHVYLTSILDGEGCKLSNVTKETPF